MNCATLKLVRVSFVVRVGRDLSLDTLEGLVSEMLVAQGMSGGAAASVRAEEVTESPRQAAH